MDRVSTPQRPSSSTSASLRLSAVGVRPVKSFAGVAARSAVIERQGLRGDRRWMLVDDAGDTVTARELPRMLEVTAVPAGDGIELSAPGHGPVRVAEPVAGSRATVTMSRVGWARAAGDAADEWVSAVLGRPLRLVWLDDPARRTVSAQHGGRPGDPLNLSDAGPVHLTTEASLAALNGWLADEQDHPPLPMERFRPSLVVAGELEPFAEDGWAGVRVGEVELRFSERCDRCVMTTVDLDMLRTTKEPTHARAASPRGRQGLVRHPAGPGQHRHRAGRRRGRPAALSTER
ncbi:MOSC domain-containing protein [Cellulomonas fulva]|uniref:MOSC domain-containing protein n=1 Tax=Cellulomonas fulva TaxID=2835530 RepID=UPI001F003EA5|nr:MOSC N-terminal beta barrel domain-containing protein [Cellulomonas fulva]